ncbi:hypothetical protein [Gemmatimonas aurantiaca]|nr:hypothetical protein [Gemmatimonas aurantiaca]
MSAQTAQRMRCHDLRYAASRRRAQAGVRVERRTTARDNTNEVMDWRAMSASWSACITAGDGTIVAKATIRLERCEGRTAEHTIVPRAGAINDGEPETRSVERQVSDEWVASATRDCGWNSCRTMATRFR